MDWAGGLIWISLPMETPAAGDDAIRGQLKNGGHATLIRASSELRSQMDVFQPQNSVTKRISEKIREGFDPFRILNPARMYSLS